MQESIYTPAGSFPAVRTEVRSHTYGDSTWRDRLTEFNGKAISYDAVGNPTAIGTANLTWQGRTLTQYADGANTYSYEYDMSGHRISKTVNGVKTTYYYDGDQLVAQQSGNDRITFMFDANGSAFGFYYNNAPYFFIKNIQGDVTAITNFAGTVIGTYTYDAWGNLIPEASNLSDEVAAMNPIRYRGYYYDAETGYYFLNSRYYDAEMGRFLNADGEMSGVGDCVQGYALFTYCFNNPVNMIDPIGNWPKWVDGVLNVVSGGLQIAVGVAVGVATSWSGVGAAAGILLVANGGATVAQGIGQIVNDVTQTNTLREDNVLRTTVQDIGGEVGGIIDGDSGYEIGSQLAGSVYDTTVAVAAAYSAVTVIAPSALSVLNSKMPQIANSSLFSFNGGYGLKIGKSIEILYRNPNAAGGLGVTIFNYKGEYGKFRIDWDIAHGFHAHPPGHK